MISRFLLKELELKLFTDSKDFFFNRVDISRFGLV